MHTGVARATCSSFPRHDRDIERCATTRIGTRHAILEPELNFSPFFPFRESNNWRSVTRSSWRSVSEPRTRTELVTHPTRYPSRETRTTDRARVSSENLSETFSIALLAISFPSFFFLRAFTFVRGTL